MYPTCYYAGSAAREAGQAKCPPGLLEPVYRYWWLAGWNERDMELNA